MSEASSPPHQPHDAFVRKVYGDLEDAASLLRRQLPASVARRICWDRLQQESGSFVDEELRQQESDMVFRAPMRVAGGEVEVWLYVLLEHQSTPDGLMPLRLLRYVVRLMERHVRRQGLPLPLVLPIVLYNGRRPWRVPLDLRELVQPDLLRQHPELAAYTPALRYWLEDLSRLDASELAESGLRASAAMALWALRASVDVGFAEKVTLMRQLLVDLMRAPQGPAAWLTILRYLSYTWGESAASRIDRVLASLPEPAKEKAMAYRDYLLKKGYEEGREEGREEGARSARRALLALIRLKFGPPDEKVRARIEGSTAYRLEALADAVLEASTVEEIFSD